MRNVEIDFFVAKHFPYHTYCFKFLNFFSEESGIYSFRDICEGEHLYLYNAISLIEIVLFRGGFIVFDNGT